jgi:hypothetical protein
MEATVRRTSMLALAVTTLALIGSETPSGAAFQAPPAAPAPGQGRLIVYGDVTTFYGVGKPENCVLRSRFKRGEPVGFRMFVADPSTGKREESAQLVVHLTFAGTSLDLPMRYRGTVKQPEREFWVAKWVVPDTAPTGIVRYSVTATDKYGRTGEFKPFAVEDSQVTIVE